MQTGNPDEYLHKHIISGSLMRKSILINVFSIIALFIFFLADGEASTDLIPSGAEAIQHFSINFLCYISIPITIRYLFLRKPIKNKWIAIGILVPIFIGFSILINIQRDELIENVNQRYMAFSKNLILT
jgi:hypothetical protein